jgi:tRNA A22 N-methylase
VRLQAVRQNLFIRDVKRRQDFEQPAEQIFYEDQIIFYFLDLDFAHKFSLNEILAASISFSQRKFFRQRNKLFQTQFLRAFLRQTPFA